MLSLFKYPVFLILQYYPHSKSKSTAMCTVHREVSIKAVMENEPLLNSTRRLLSLFRERLGVKLHGRGVEIVTTFL